MTDYTIRHKRTIVLTSEYASAPTIEAEYIGRGRYCEAYRNGRDVYLLSSEADLGKEIACSLESMTHLPTCEYLGWVGDRRLYKMPYYRTVTASDKKAWAQYERVLKAWQGADRDINFSARLDYDYGYGLLITVRDALSGTSLGRAVGEIADRCADYGASWTLEIAKRNCGVGQGGNLILRDCWFDPQEVAKGERA